MNDPNGVRPPLANRPCWRSRVALVADGMLLDHARQSFVATLVVESVAM